LSLCRDIEAEVQWNRSVIEGRKYGDQKDLAKQDMDFGVLTLATRDDYQKAIGLALSVRLSNPGVPIAVACPKSARPLLAPYFDFVISDDPSIRGFEHKLHLDRYSPFDNTFFFDADVLVFRNLLEVYQLWREHSYTACGRVITGGISPFGLDRVRALSIIGREHFVCIDGAGHAFFRKPDCFPVFELAREFATNYAKKFGVSGKLADEDVMGLALSSLNLKTMPGIPFWSRYLSGKRGTVKMNAAESTCEMELAETGEIQHPYMMHFAANEAPFAYARQLSLLFKRFGISTRGLMSMAIRDYYVTDVEWPIRQMIKRNLRRSKLPGVFRGTNFSG
jgi:hypothetical protein